MDHRLHRRDPTRAAIMRHDLALRVLVTGGSGFLGSHLCDRLLAGGAEVLCVDNFFTGTRRNIEHLLDVRRFEVVHHDVTFALCGEFDQMYKLACAAPRVYYDLEAV